MKLRFVNGKVIEPRRHGAWTAYRAALRETTGPEPAGGDERASLGVADLTAAEREQLVGILKEAFGLQDERFSAEDVFSGASGHEALDEAAETPVEWWDLADETGAVRYQLWTYHADCGALVPAGSAARVGAIIQFSFDVEVEDPGHALGEAMREAHADLRRRCPRSELAGMDFRVDTDD